MTELVWITGAGGFLGTELMARLVRANRRLGVIGRLLPAHVDAGPRTFAAVRDALGPEALDLLAHQTGPPTMVFHCAGGASVGKSIDDPITDYRDTVDASRILFEWLASRCPRARVITMSSAAVYGCADTPLQSEVDDPNPISPYGKHKLQVEEMAKEFWQTARLRVLPVRLFSLYGPGLRKQLFWDIARRVICDGERQLTLRGTGTEQRDWVDVAYAAEVLDRLAGLDGLFEGPPEPINLGTGKPLTVRQAAQTFLSALDAGVQLTFSGVDTFGDPPVLVADVHRLRKIGIAAPDQSSQDGIARLAGLYRETLAR